MNNLIIIGMPGSWKSTLSKILSEKIGYNFVDFDDDVIELSEGISVWLLAKNLSESDFKQLEEKLCLWLNFSKTVFSTSWSLPYSSKAMQHLRTLWTIVYLKADTIEIKSRMSHMKTDRIIGMKDNNLSNLLKEREKLYLESADIIFPYSWNNLDEISQNLIQKLWHIHKK